MSKQFIREFFNSRATGGAFFILLAGIILAWVSMKTCSVWLTTYLQGLSTTAIGMSLGVLILQLLLDLQRKSIGDQLRKARESAVSTTLSQTARYLEKWIPTCDASDLEGIHVSQLKWALEHVKRLRDDGTFLSLEVQDQLYRQELEAFVTIAERLCDSIEVLVRSIEMTAPKKRLQSDLDEARTVVETFKGQTERILTRLTGDRDDPLGTMGG